MAIEFKCTTCGKALFAQEQYAGMRTTCPGCQTKMPIPVPPAMQSPPAPVECVPADTEEVLAAAAVLRQDQRKDPELIDVEKLIPQSGPIDPVKRCPTCAETIKAAAKKCRFCGEIFDPELQAEEAFSRRQIDSAAGKQLALRSIDLFRGASILATMLTNGWLIMLTLDSISLKSMSPTFHAPWTFYVFNVLLIGGLFSLMRQMRTGPHNVFVAAGIAIVLCMPLDIALGFVPPGMNQVIADVRSKGEIYKDLPEQQFYFSFAIIFGFIGLLISLPVWFTAVKLALKQYGPTNKRDR